MILATRVVTTSRLKAPRHLAEHVNFKTFTKCTKPIRFSSVKCTLHSRVQFDVIIYTNRSIGDLRRYASDHVLFRKMKRLVR